MRKKIGLALGSGSSRGWAHIGVINALEEAKIPIDFIAGCSVGSYIGAIYAGGGLKSLQEFLSRMTGKKVFSYFDFVIPRSGFLDGTKRLKELYFMHCKAKTFSELNMPFKVVATDFKTGSKVVIDSGNIIDAIRASMTVPGVFEPAKHRNRWLLDGGLVDPVPVGIARAMGADIVIAVDLNTGLISKSRRIYGQKKEKPAIAEEKTEFKNEFMKKLVEHYERADIEIRNKITSFRNKPGPPAIIEIVMKSISIMQERITRMNLAVEPPDILIQPRLGDIKMLDFDHAPFAIEEGYKAMKDKMHDLKMIL